MPGLGFSAPNLATVAYAEVDGTTGASTATNSGVTSTRVSAGTYVVVLPTGITQAQARDLIFVQAKVTPVGTIPGSPAFATVDDSLEATKTIVMWSGNPANPASTNVDFSFSILILRTTIAPPTGAPA
jgi:hypothetical protein